MYRVVRTSMVALLVFSTWTGTARAERCDPAIADVASVQGTVETKPAGGADWQPTRMADELCAGDVIRAAEKGRADVRLANESVLRIRSGTEMTLQGATTDDTYVVDMVKGAAHFFSRKGARSLKVNTPFTVAGVRGTEFMVEVGDDEALVSVFEGRVLAQNDQGDLNLSGGQTAVATRGQAPVLRVVARPRDAVQWALHYLPVLYLDPSTIPDGAGWQGKVRQSTDQYLAGDLQAAFASLDGVDDAAVRDPRFFAYRASLLLAVGNVGEATADIDRALALAPEDANALSLQAIIAIARNEIDEALAVSQRAVAADPSSATARIALSYAQQASFDLYAARETVEEAVALAPNDALAWARLAELRSSFGETNGALEAAEQAASLEPNLSRTQTVLGFVHLTRVDTEAARTAFDRAIVLDQGDPLPRLGLGLAKIRDGRLDEGGRDIEVAASLDPNDATIRSYLGKTYFEEKRTGLDEREYDTAKQLDPNDPTPWFYDAIAKQTTNRPVEALRANQKAIELNDNRAVYRSRLLLDSDLASRSAALGRIYGDLGFEHLALVEGWKSLTSDPSNFSAHRLLADSYAARPRHEIARVSELFQSQMLQPLNLTPIQPRLGESNLFLVSAQGPGALSFSEFNPLFNRNRVAFQGNGLVGEDDTWSGEGVVSAVYDKASFSGGYTHYEADGFRPNNDLEDRIGTAFAQVEITPQTSVQAEYRYRNRENGDLELRFFEDDFSRFFDADIESHTGRVGLRHAFSPRSTFLASYIYQHKHIGESDFAPGNPVVTWDELLAGVQFGPDRTLRAPTHEKAHSGEAQYLYQSPPIDAGIDSVKVVTGVGYFDIDKKDRETLSISDTTILGNPFCFDPENPQNGFFTCDQTIPGAVINDQTTRPDVHHLNLYLYSYLSFPENITVTLGLSGDLLHQEAGIDDDDRINPKFGIEWAPSFVPGMTVRAAAFKMMKRTLITDQTLEPTQVAGFNQFFDDVNGTHGWRYGGAIDQKFSDSIFGGVEYSERDLTVPAGLTGIGSVITEADWDEQLARAYFYWTPFDWLALRAEYQWERFERDPFDAGLFFAFKEVKTHRIPFGVQVFHPIGVSAMLGATWLHQKGEFYREDIPACPPACLDEGSRDFWVLDTAVRYRLPKRYGFVSFGVNNFLDEDSTYQATDVRNPSIRPGRFIFGNVTLSFP